VIYTLKIVNQIESFYFKVLIGSSKLGLKIVLIGFHPCKWMEARILINNREEKDRTPTLLYEFINDRLY
jgi:hypothetical protein